MTFDRRLLQVLRQGLLATALVAPYSACGGDDASDEDSSTDKANADDGDDGTDDSSDDSTSSTRKDGGMKDASVMKDAGKPVEKPTDAGGGQTTEKDAGIAKLDAGGGSTRDAGGGGTVTPPSGGYQRGPAPTSASASTKGPYQFKTYTDGYRDGPKYADSTIHYPVDADPPYAIMAIVPGFVSPQSSIQNWGPFLASHGIVTMTIGTNTPADQPPDREAALMDALETLKSENTREGSPLKGKLDLSRQAVGGWSMGGGGTLLAAVDNPSLKAAMAICPWNPVHDYSGDKVPSLMFAGTLDVLAGGQSQGFYQSIPESTPKLLWEVSGADHFFANDPAGQSGAVGRYGLSFVKVFLEGDERYRQFLKEKGPNASDFRTNM
jgi:dienelactone hydrolase